MLAWNIALRYIFSKKSHSAVNIISLISVIGVSVATMAITIVLSVFNGFTDLAAKHLSILDPQIKVSPLQGKVIADGDSLASLISNEQGVTHAIPVIEERGLVIVGQQQMPVNFKGVPAGYNQIMDIDTVMLEGIYASDLDGFETTQISSGVAISTGARTATNNQLSLYVPRRVGRINPANPTTAFSGVELIVSGIFQIGQAEYDMDHIFIDLPVARDMLQYDTEATSIEVSLDPSMSEDEMVQKLKKLLGPSYRIETRAQQQQESFRMIQIEKWVTFLMLAFILIIASFNIISTLSLMVIEKRSNMATLRALGAPMSLLRRIFVIIGWLISVVGGLVGIALGSILALCQQHFGWIKLAGDPTHLTISVYPVRVELIDLVIVFALVMMVGLLTSQVTRFFSLTDVTDK